MKHIVLTSPPDNGLAGKWNAFLADAPFATHYVTPNYFADPYIRGEKFAVLAVEDNDKIAAVMTGVFDREKIISGLFSRPQMVCGNGADRERAITALLDGVNELGNKTKLIEIYTWEKIPEFAGHAMQIRPSNNETSVVIIDLSIGPDAIFANFSQTRRNELRKVIRQGLVEVKALETDRELVELYKIHCDWCSRKGNRADTFEQMRIAAFDQENRRVFIAKTEGKVIAGSFYRFAPGALMEYAGNFSMPEYQKLRPNDLIGWRAIEWACSSGISLFSMGGSHLFLRRFGGEIMTTYRYRRDQSRFHLYDLRENALEFGLETYRRLPANIRLGMKKVLAK